MIPVVCSFNRLSLGPHFEQVEITGNGADEPLDYELSDDPHAVTKLSLPNFPGGHFSSS